jgi:hypothetical protein
VSAAQEASDPFRTVLVRDLRDVRQIGKMKYGSFAHYKEGIRDLLNYYKTAFPALIAK